MQTAISLREEIALADWTRTMKRSVLRDMLAVVSRPGILSFAGGLPAPDLFPSAQLAESFARVLASDPRSLQYGPPFAPLKQKIVDLMALRGVTCTEEQIFLTTGAQQGLDILARLLLNRGGQVLIEETVYTGIQQVIAPFEPEILTVPTDLESGINVSAVETLLERGARPAFIYAITDAHNPLGVSISASKRRRLVDIARRYGVPLIEDDPYGLLNYEKSPNPPMRSLDAEWVFYLGSFSKILAPALRVGWIVAPTPLLPRLTVVKEASDLETSALMQRAIADYLQAGHLPGHLETLRGAYRQRRDSMLAALRAYFPREARWTEPTSGMFIWVELPGEVDTTYLLQRALEEEQVAFIPGSAFCVDVNAEAARCLRLNFSNSTPEQISDGVGRLARVIRRYISAPATTG